MPLHDKTPERLGWEPIWGREKIPKRFASFAAPSSTVVEWTNQLIPGGFVLDVGCGVGRHCTFLAKRGFQVAGMDNSPTGIQLAQRACASRNIPFDGRVCDMSALPWADETFDAALSISTIHHGLRANVAKAIQEVARVLKPGGEFLVDLECTQTMKYTERRTLTDAGQITEIEPNTFIDLRPDSNDIDGYLPHHFSDEADVRDLLRPFEIVRLWAALHTSTSAASKDQVVGKWVAWVRKPVLPSLSV
jgi:SAM-dependent methyltransferase